MPAEREIDTQRELRIREQRATHPNPTNPQRRRFYATELILFLCLVVIFYAALKYLARVP